MFDTKDFSFLEHTNNFDFKGFLFKTLSHWKLFLLSWAIAFVVAYQVNIRKEKIYAVNNTISVKEESNPFFTSNTSLVFNWGGSSDKVQNVTTMLRSRSHNEEVVNRMQLYINYYIEGEYNKVDAYGSVPFYVDIDMNKGQLANTFISVQFVNANQYKITIPFENESINLIHYNEDSSRSIAAPSATFTKTFQVGEQVDLPFLSWKLKLNESPGMYIGKEFFVKFDDFNSTVASYQSIDIEPITTGSSILTLSMQGTNKSKMVNYLNTTVDVLRDNQLAAKNQFATNTVKFIDSAMIKMESQLKDSENELKSFRKGKDVIQLESGGERTAERLFGFELEKDAILRKVAYYNTLKSYLNDSNDFSKLPAPSVAGIDDPNITGNVSKLITLSVERANKRYVVKNSDMYEQFDSKMIAVRDVLLVNIASAKQALQYDLNMITGKINQAESELQNLPENQQELFKIQRKYNLSDNIYSSFLAKRLEAEIVKAANVSDIKFIDTAKDIGGGNIGPKTGVNYILALFGGFLLPFVVILVLFLLNNSIQHIEDLEKLTKIPVIGVVGRKHTLSNLSVFERPKSALSESFRALRSSLQFLYKKQNLDGAKTLMITSSVSGEGKTFCSINIATVFALSEKKTIIVGLDLRKPKLFNDFEIPNEKGVVNYLIGSHLLDEVIHPTKIANLDLIPAGPLPPNPGELLMSEHLEELIAELKKRYDYIILDTPPVGLVSDAMELSNFADVVLYIVRQDYTKKGMISQLNLRNKRGELKNVSIVLNSFENKTQNNYGYGYGYSYGYGYGDYSNEYLHSDQDDNKKTSLFKKIFGSKK